MKRIIFLLVTFVVAQCTQGQWYWNNPNLGVGFLNDIALVNDFECWAVGNHGQVFYTSDGGLNWKQRYLDTDFDLYSICFTDDNHGWIAGGNGKVYYTLNGGLDWDVTFVGYTIQLNSIEFLDQFVGWVVGESGRAFYSNNGGENWEEKQMPGPPHTLNSIFFINDNKGWICGDNGSIYHTSDGGINWDLQASGDWEKQYNSVYFMNDQLGWVVGRIDFISETSGILKTENGGEEWVLTHSFSGCLNLTGVSFLDENIGYIVGYNGHLYITEDGGANWDYQSIEAGFYARDIECRENELWVTGGWGYTGDSGCEILQSSDSGSNWEGFMNRQIIGDIRTIEAIDSLTIWIWADDPDRSLFRSIDGGVSWEKKLDLDSHLFMNFSFISANEGWTMGTFSVLDNIVLKTMDGGESWDTLANLPYAGQISSFQFLSPEIGWFIDWTQSSKIFKTMDGGYTWEVCLDPDVWSVNSLYFMDTQMGWAACTIDGGGGALYQTSDGGVNWTLDTIAEKGLRSVFFIDELLGWCNTEDLVYYTTDGGGNWDESIVLGSEGLTKVEFISNEIGWCYDFQWSEEKSSAYISMDGGITWMEDYTGASNEFYDMGFDTDGNGWIVGSNGQVLKRNIYDVLTTAKQGNQKTSTFEILPFPNPFTNMIQLNLPPAYEILKVQFFDINGREVHTHEVPAGERINNGITIHTESLKKGVYILQFITKRRIFSKKVIKTN